MTNSRRTAAFIVARWLATKEFPADMLPTGADRSFVQDLVYTVVRRMRALRLALSRLVRTWPKGELEALLYVGAAQILYMEKVPDFAAVNETVEAAKLCENPSIAKVTNAVLRNMIRRRDELVAELAASAPEVRESFPTIIYRRWEKRFGADEAARLAAWHNTPAEAYIARKDGTFEKLQHGVRIDQLDGYAEGDFIVQDPGTSLAVNALSPAPGDSILDACAAPGGKTIQLAWRGASVTACEVNPKRARRLEENLRRTGLRDKVKVIAELPAAQDAQFDKILVDAPCSNTGVFRRRPDARWNWSEEKLAALVRLQSQILDACAPRVKAGGIIVYSTCSNEPEENQRQVEAFVSRHPDFALEESAESIPTQSGCDGAFAAILRRKVPYSPQKGNAL